MKKGKRLLLLVLIYFAIVAYCTIYLIIGRKLGPNKVNEETIQLISSIVLILPILIVVIIYILIKKKKQRKIENYDKLVTENSEKIDNLIKINKKYEFKEISKKTHTIPEQEYSRKSLDRVTGEEIIKYHIENNIENIRTDIENAIDNLSIFAEYKKEIDELSKSKSYNKTSLPDDKYEKIEKRVFNQLCYQKKDIVIKVNLHAFYKSYGGNVSESRYGVRYFEQLLVTYNEWKDGNKYSETIRQERKIMNNDIRYNVLKRDNFTCQLCGITAKDGAKLEVDHIIPVSKGGKTIMSNLQTLCDRCNKGKSNKTDTNINENLNKCPRCGGNLVERHGQYGRFIGCSNYPKCRYTRK